MQTETVEFQLREGLEHLQNLVAEIRNGTIKEDDEPAISVRLGHILEHICLAWNCKDMTIEQAGQLSQSEFVRLSNTVPNFLGERILGEFAFS